MLFPNKFKQTIIYAVVNYDYVHSELKKAGVTLKLLWEEYCINCKTNKELPCNYQRFCIDYNKYVENKKVVSHIDHKPGIVVEVDWAGKTMSFNDENTLEVIKVYLFVATLPYSQYTYVEGTLSMDEATWINCHVNMFNYFGGVPTRLVCDNLKTGVISHPKKGEIVLNKSYENLGDYYKIAILPARVKRPTDKVSVETNVGKITTAIIAKLRNEKYTSLNALNVAIKKELNKYNDAPFQKREGSRTKVFEEVEKPLLKPLPQFSYEPAMWSYKHVVGYNSHISFKKNFYSVPYQFIRKTVDIKYTSKIIEIFYDGKRIASHIVFPSFVTNKYQTETSHMPEKFNQPEWNYDRVCDWAKKIGPNTYIVISRIFNSVKVKEQGLNPALAVLRLSKDYSPMQLEKACEEALVMTTNPRYRHISTILKNNQQLDDKELKEKVKSNGFVRGKEYYGGNKNE